MDDLWWELPATVGGAGVALASAAAAFWHRRRQAQQRQTRLAADIVDLRRRRDESATRLQDLEAQQRALRDHVRAETTRILAEQRADLAETLTPIARTLTEVLERHDDVATLSPGLQLIDRQLHQVVVTLNGQTHDDGVSTTADPQD